MRLSLVIPAYNESLRIERTLRAYRAALEADAEIIVVANHCSDDTAAIAQRVAREMPGITVLDIPAAIGKGSAVRAGFERAQGQYVGFADADLATPPDELHRVWDAAMLADGAIASRWAPGSRVAGRTAGRSVASRVYAAFVRALLGLPFADTQCGAKIFHRRYLPGYLAASRVSDLAFDVELLLLLTQAGARVTEVPTLWISQPGSSSLGTPAGFAKHAVRMVRSLVALWWRRHHPAPVPSGVARGE